MGSRDPMQVCRLGSTQLSLQPCVTVPGASFIRVLTLSEVIFFTTQSLKAPPLRTITLASQHMALMGHIPSLDFQIAFSTQVSWRATASMCITSWSFKRTLLNLCLVIRTNYLFYNCLQRLSLQPPLRACHLPYLCCSVLILPASLKRRPIWV